MHVFPMTPEQLFMQYDADRDVIYVAVKLVDHQPLFEGLQPLYIVNPHVSLAHDVPCNDYRQFWVLKHLLSKECIHRNITFEVVAGDTPGSMVLTSRCELFAVANILQDVIEATCPGGQRVAQLHLSPQVVGCETVR